MKKKVLICALLSATALTATAAFTGCGLFGGDGSNGGDGVTQDNMRFELKDDGTYELVRYEYANLDDWQDRDGNIIEGYKGEGETVTVPDTVNGKAVTSVKEYAFAGKGVKLVTLPDAVTVLPDRIFESCKLLETVNTSVITSIGKTAFYECVNLANIEFVSGLTEIGDRAFGSCTSLATVTLPDTVTVIGESCFRECPVGSINTAGVEVLGDFAFYQCANITSLNLPNVVSIGERAFGDCDKLTEMLIGDKLESCVSGLNGLQKVSINSPVPANMFKWAEKLSDVTLGAGVTSIGEMAFGYCSQLNDITLPETLAEIGRSAFEQSGITSVTVPAAVNAVGENAFYCCRSLASVTVENGVESVGASAFEESGITALSLPASVKTVGDKAFKDCNKLVQITFDEGLESIGNSAFSIKGAETLEIVLPTTVRTLGDGCFKYGNEYNKTGITANKIIINETVETVGEDILNYGKVKELKAPASYGHNATVGLTLTLFGEGEIPYEAYYYSAALKTVYLGGKIKTIGSRAFKALESITLSGVEYMGDNALGSLSSLTYSKSENGVNYIDNWVISTDYSQGGATNLDLSGYTGIYGGAFRKTDTNDTSVLNTVAFVGSGDTSALKFIGARAFEGTGITAVEIPASLATWNGAFSGCRSLSTVALQQGVEKIADRAFTDCTNLTGVNFAASDLKEIGGYAFSGCKGLKLVTLPDGIKKLGEYAFNYCDALLSIDLKGTEEIGESAFGYCTSLGEAIMNSVITIGDSAFERCAELTEFDLPASVTAIGRYALGNAETVNYDGTPTQWAKIVKGNAYGRDIWYTDNDLTVVFADGGSTTLHKGS